MADRQIERLDRSHDRGSFSCGKPPRDELIRRLVAQYKKRNLGRTDVAIHPGEKWVSGYDGLASRAIALQSLPEPTARRLPKHPIPVGAIDQQARAFSEESGLGPLTDRERPPFLPSATIQDSTKRDGA